MTAPTTETKHTEAQIEPPITADEWKSIEDGSRHLFQRCRDLRGSTVQKAAEDQHDAFMRLRRRLVQLEDRQS